MTAFALGLFLVLCSQAAPAGALVPEEEPGEEDRPYRRAETWDGRFGEIISFYFDGFFQEGNITEEHGFTARGGASYFSAAGLGFSRGSVEILTREKLDHRSFFMKEYYTALTGERAVPGDYVRMGSTARAGSDQVTVGVEPLPGEEGLIRQKAARSVEGEKSYYEYKGGYSQGDGSFRMSSDLEIMSTEVSVDGEAVVREKVVEDRGASRPSWLDSRR